MKFFNIFKEIFGIPSPIVSCSDLTDEELSRLRYAITDVIINTNHPVKIMEIASSFIMNNTSYRLFSRKVEVYTGHY